MSYILGQYNKNKTVHDDNIFMTLITEGDARRKAVSSDTGVIGSGSLFEDECIYIPSNLEISKTYYFHGKIKRMLTAQVFDIKIINYDAEGEDYLEQYIKTVTVGAGDPHEWVDIEFMFTPLATFDTILFQLQRSVVDYREEIRYPVIAFQELSQIENLISSRIKAGVRLIKIGVQSRPGMMICLNGEEIHIPRSGIYEIKNGIMSVNLFSAINSAKEETDVVVDWMQEINDAYDQSTTEEERKNIRSRCFFDSSKSRTIDSFTLDYIYEE